MTKLKEFKSAASVVAISIVLNSGSNSEVTIGDEVEPLLNDFGASEIISEPAEQEIPPESIPQPSLTFFFDIDDDSLGPQHEQQLWDVADYLVKTGSTFEIVGCESLDGNRNTNPDNGLISWRRANELKYTLEDFHIPKEQFKDTYAKGDECETLVEGVKDTPAEQRSARIVLNPDYSGSNKPTKHTPSEFETTLFKIMEGVSSALSVISPPEPEPEPKSVFDIFKFD